LPRETKSSQLMKKLNQANKTVVYEAENGVMKKFKKENDFITPVKK